jgi:hypothetical protein
LGGTICVRVDQDDAFKKCCMTSGTYDGSRRNYFFQRIARKGATHGRAFNMQHVLPEESDLFFPPLLANINPQLLGFLVQMAALQT